MNHTFFIPITKVDEEQRTVTGIATSSAIDSQGDIVDYQASKKAFSEWTGNIREMHEPKAIGKRIDVQFDDAKEQVIVTAKLSESADGQNAWVKVKEGILAGFSIGGKIFDVARETVKSDDGESIVSRIKDYALTELSLVDVPANPDAQLLMVKSVGGALQSVEEEVTPQAVHNVWWLNKYMLPIEKAQKLYDENSMKKSKEVKKSLWDASWLMELALSLQSYISMEQYEGEDVNDLVGALATIKQAIVTEINEPTEELTVAVELASKVTNLKKDKDMSKDDKDLEKSTAVNGGEERNEVAEVVTTAEENGRPENDTEERAKENKTEVDASAGSSEEEAVDTSEEVVENTETTVIDGEVVDVLAENAEAAKEDEEVKEDSKETEETESKKKSDEPIDLVKSVQALVTKLDAREGENLQKVVDSIDGLGAEIKKYRDGLKDLDSRLSKLESQPLPTKGQAAYVDVSKGEEIAVDQDREALLKRQAEITANPSLAKPGEAFEIYKALNR